jgi:HD-like signal output (HDOD) protein
MATEVPASVIRLLEAIQKSGEFPTMAYTVDVISSMTSSESTSSGALAEIILQDFGLTQKLLRLVNTLAYTQYGEVTTISRAVLLMGFDRVRSMATSLILFEHFRKQAGSTGLLNVLNKAFYGAVIGRTIAHDTGFVDGEEAFISTLFHRLGWILVAFYLPDEYAAIEAAPENDRDRVVTEVLGLSFDAIGTTVAGELKISPHLRESMMRVPRHDLNRVMSPCERLSCLAALSNSMVDVLTTSSDSNTKRQEVEQLMMSYGRQIKVPDNIDTLISRTVREVKGSASTFKLKVVNTPLAASLAAWGLSEKGVVGTQESESGALEDESGENGAAHREAPETVLTKGLHEVTALLMGDYAFDDVLRVVMETIYRALGVGHSEVLFLLKDPAAPVVRYRFGFGQKPDEAALWAEVHISGTDLISQSINQGRDVVIRNARVPTVIQSLPGFLARRGMLDRVLILLPLTVGSSPVGLFFIDGDRELAPILTPTFVNHLKVLRNQVVIAIRQRTDRKA